MFFLSDVGRMIKLTRLLFLFSIFGFSYKVEARNAVYNISYDLSAIPQQWSGNEIDTNYAYDRFRLITCNSIDYTPTGACPTGGEYGPLIPSSAPMNTWGNIRLELREINTHQSIIVNIKAYRKTIGCDNRYLWDITDCKLKQYFPSIVVGMEHNTLENIPAGNWEGHLVLNQRDYKNPSSIIDSFAITFTVNVTDSSKELIYFPAFPTADPHVDLNLNFRPNSGKNGGVSGSSSLDMCLYDGGTSAKTVQLLFQDESENTMGKAADLFSIYRDGADKNKGGNRIDYKLQVVNPTTGSHDIVLNGKVITWQNTNAKNIQRKVVLPGIPGVSLCLPAPLNFITPTFNYSEKSSGHYTGVLRVIYSIATN